MPESAESYALMSVFDLTDTMRLPRWRRMVKICSLCRRWRRWAEPMVVILSSADWLPPDQIRYGLPLSKTGYLSHSVDRGFPYPWPVVSS